MAFQWIGDVLTFLDELGGRQTARPVIAVGTNIVVFPVTIASGGSLSNAADIGPGALVGLIPPAAWTTASVTFNTSPDMSTYNNLYDDLTERVMATGLIVTGRQLVLVPSEWRGCRGIKIRSGTGASPVIQDADRIFKLVAAY